MNLEQKVRDAFKSRFAGQPAMIVRAPGRVNLIGEHTDYNDGFVMPMAIDRSVWIALRPAQGRRVTVHSLDFDKRDSFALEGLQKNQSKWLEYLKGVAWVLQEAGYTLAGWEGVLTSDVPIGAGLSSSAALELATARAFQAVSGFDWEPKKMALLGQRAENKWVGVNCGIMDQLISAAGKAGHALLIDCRSLDCQPAPLPAGVAVVILDTATRRGLDSSAYNERRLQCETVAKFFGVKALRDVDVATFEARQGELEDVFRRRARHVITEDDRTLKAAEALRRGDIGALGRLLDASHASLRDDYEVSCQELNAMVDCARDAAGCLGARMTGAGFGGCAVALVEEARAEVFAQSVTANYEKAVNLKPHIYVCQAAEGAEARPA
ncbi:MAG: galactokinase [bacterium]|nr:galactokinase [bacterium]